MQLIQPARALRGTLKLSGDKSISHRAAMLASIAHGETRITNFATSLDCHSTLNCLRRLGVRIEVRGTNVRINNPRIDAKRAPFDLCFAAPTSELDCGNSGTTMRLLAGLLAWHTFTTTLAGDRSLSARPMSRIIAPLAQMGAQFEATNGHAPLRITGRASLEAIRYELPVASAQVKSAVLLAGLGARERTEVIEKLAPTRDHTERLLGWFGVQVEVKNQTSDDATNLNTIIIEGGARLAARPCHIPGDVSSAAFLIAAATLLPDAELHIENVGLNPTRTQFITTLRTLGAQIETEITTEECGEPVGNITVRGASTLQSSQAETHVICGKEIANLIDELPMLAVVGTQTEGGLIVRDARELRVKETDRIRAIVENLRRMNAEVEEYADGFAVRGKTKLRGATLDSYGDHRIAMAFSVAALIARGESQIKDADCVGVSFPNFYELLERLIEH